jgi:phospho-N-acetylmuramoyl-pentapeptide-transferase
MLYHALFSLFGHLSFTNVFRYITFRTGGAILTALIISFVMGKPLINWLKSKQGEGQPIREDGPASHLLTKKGTPTMGGCLILTAIVMSTLLWMDFANGFVWILLGVTLGFGAIGSVDDYFKLTKRSHRGMSGKMKLLMQTLVSLIGIYFITLITSPKISQVLTFPFFKDFTMNLGWAFIPWAVFVIVGSSNAVNLTDGLDGLAIVPIMIAAACFGLISYLVGHTVFSHYLQIHYVANTGESAVFLGSMVGASLGFLWFNAPPAKVFMGDTGSLAVGGALGAVAVITKHEIVLAIIGGLFVMEAVSVILQVGYYKLTKKRIFLMAPIHHHFEKK